jgi:hypothetical protein
VSPVRDDSDTVGLLEAARVFGISKSMAYRMASSGEDLTPGVKVLRFGTTSRPVYRVSKAVINAILAAPGGNDRADDAAEYIDLETMRAEVRRLDDLIAKHLRTCPSARRAGRVSR